MDNWQLITSKSKCDHFIIFKCLCIFQRSNYFLVSLKTFLFFFNTYFFFSPFPRRYSSVPFPVPEHVRPKGVRVLLQRHDVLGDALAEQQLLLPPPTGRLPGHQALRHVMPSRTLCRTQRARCDRHGARQAGRQREAKKTSTITTERGLPRPPWRQLTASSSPDYFLLYCFFFFFFFFTHHAAKDAETRPVTKQPRNNNI